MKLYAFVRRQEGDRLIHVWEAERLRQKDGEKERYYSTELDASRRQEMVLVHREGLMFFRYKKLPEDGSADSAGQTLTHLKMKEFLCQMSHVKLMLPEGMLELWVEKWKPEYRMEMEEGRVVVADLLAVVCAAQPADRVRRWPQKVLLEITVTHPTERDKVLALEEQGYPVIEIPVDTAWRIPEGLTTSEETVLAAEEKLRERLNTCIPARILTEPGRPLIKKSGLWQKWMRFLEEIITN